MSTRTLNGDPCFWKRTLLSRLTAPGHPEGTNVYTFNLDQCSNPRLPILKTKEQLTPKSQAAKEKKIDELCSSSHLTTSE